MGRFQIIRGKIRDLRGCGFVTHESLQEVYLDRLHKTLSVIIPYLTNFKNITKGKLQNMAMLKIISKNKSREHIAKMFYKSLSYEGKIHKIDLTIGAGMEFLPNGGMTPKYYITCNKQNPHSEEEFVKEATKSDKNFIAMMIIGALNKADTRRISVMVIPDNIDVSDKNDEKMDQDVVAILNTPMIEPTDEEHEEILKFINFIESVED